MSRGEGTLSDDDLRGHQAAVRADPKFDPGFRQLWDFRAVSEVAVSTDCVRDLSRTSSFAEGSRRALVVHSDLQFGLARMFQTLTEHTPHVVGVFRDLDEARAWLGLD